LIFFAAVIFIALVGFSIILMFHNKRALLAIDEFIGQSIPLLICENNFFLIILSLLLFRLFDITKPWPASYFDFKIKNATGVIMDDVIAGIYTFLIIYLCI
jgi:phosphatidylglycerophosphatase A